MLNYQQAAKVLDELMLVLIENGTKMPLHVTNDLKTGRSLASIGSRKPEDNEISAKSMAALEKAEMNLLSLAELNLGRETAETWQKRIGEAYKKPSEKPAAPAASRLASGVPKGDHWVRIQSHYLDTVEGAKELLEKTTLAAIDQKDGYLLVHGRKEDVSALLKELRQIIGKMGSECNI